jgi:thiamine pyrophosphokinase
MDKFALVFANGLPADPAVWRDLLQQDPLLVATDGGADQLLRAGMVPHLVIGDMDSVQDEQALRSEGVLIIRQQSQENTDLEKALDFLLEQRYLRVMVLSAMGLRSDHTLANLSILLKYHARLQIRFRDNYSEISVVSGEHTFAAAPGTTVSLLAAERCTGVTTNGLQWPLQQQVLAPGLRESISNRVVSSPVKIQIASGRAWLFVSHFSSGGR